MPDHIRNWAQTDLPVWAEGAQLPTGVLGAQAAVLRQRVQQGIPAWYDTLPSIELVAQNEQAEPTWIQLLQDDAAWVAGGQPWRRPNPISGFSLPAGQIELVLPIAHEEFDTVRDVSIGFKQNAPKTVPIEIEVEMTPAQGQARLKVVPAGRQNTGVDDLDRGVLANWQYMRDTGMDAQSYLSNMPRAFPPVLPRIASWDRWRLSKNLVCNILADQRLTEYRVRQLSDELKQTDSQARSQKMQDKQATLASSDGIPATEDARQYLNQLVKLMIDELKGSSDNADLIRAIGYTSTDNRYFQNFLIDQLAKSFRICPKEIYFACSFSLRDPKGFELLVKHAVEDYGNNRRVTNYRLIAISRCLQYRPRICETLELETAQTLVIATLAMFNEQLDKRNGKMIFRNSATLLGYLLRYRMIQPDFLSMDGELTTQLRNAFAKAYFLSDMYRSDSEGSMDLRQRFPRIHNHSLTVRNKVQTIGGVIDIQAALLQLLAYVERRGKGILQMIADG